MEDFLLVQVSDKHIIPYLDMKYYIIEVTGILISTFSLLFPVSLSCDYSTSLTVSVSISLNISVFNSSSLWLLSAFSTVSVSSSMIKGPR